MSDMSQTPGEQVRLLRESARRARRLAMTFSVDADREKLLKYSEELDQQAMAIEQQTGVELPPPPPIVQVQVQQQQQHETGPPADPEESKPKD